MAVDRWSSGKDGKLSEAALRRKLEAKKYGNLQRFVFPPSVFFPEHLHATDRIEAVFSGRFRVTMGKEEYELGPGDTLSIPEGTAHCAEVLNYAPVVCWTADKASEESLSNPGARVLTLALLLVLGNAWAVRHLGLELKDLLVVNAILVVLPQLQSFLDRQEGEAVQTFLRRGMVGLLVTPTLVALSLVILFVGSLWSSVAVIPPQDSSTENLSMKLVDPDAGPSSAPIVKTELHDVSKRLIMTSPFGRPLRLEVDGYNPHSFVLFPLWEKRIQVSQLDPSISLWLRLPKEFVRSGTLELWQGSRMLGQVTISGNSGNMLFVTEGKAPVIPEEAVRDIEDELKEIEDLDERREIQRAWTKPQVVESPVRLTPGARLKALYYSANNEDLIQAQLLFTVPNQEFQSYRLEATEPSTVTQ